MTQATSWRLLSGLKVAKGINDADTEKDENAWRFISRGQDSQAK
jgi:hypothetical protein